MNLGSFAYWLSFPAAIGDRTEHAVDEYSPNFPNFVDQIRNGNFSSPMVYKHEHVEATIANFDKNLTRSKHYCNDLYCLKNCNLDYFQNFSKNFQNLRQTT